MYYLKTYEVMPVTVNGSVAKRLLGRDAREMNYECWQNALINTYKSHKVLEQQMACHCQKSSSSSLLMSLISESLLSSLKLMVIHLWESMFVIGVTNVGCRYTLRHPRYAVANVCR
jgi:hypothetical protein